MSIRVMSSVWELSLSSTEKLVLLALADCANDEGECWPSIATIGRKAGIGERSVQRSIQSLKDAGHLSRREVPGRGCRYTIHPRHSATPATVAPVTNETPPPPQCHPTPATVAPKPSMNHQEPSKLEPKGSCASADAPGLKPEHVVEVWNEHAPRLGKPTVRNLTPERRQLLKARIGQYPLDDFHAVFGKIEMSAFLRGDTGWRGCTFDWVFKKANFQKILEGNYDQ